MSAESLSHGRLLVAQWIVAHQAPLSMGFPRHEYWSGLPFPFPGDLPKRVIKPRSPAWEMDSLPLNHQGRPIHSSTVLNILYSNLLITIREKNLEKNI